MLLGASASASADTFDPLGFRSQSPAYVVHERDGAAVITIVRADTRREAQIRYGAWPITAVRRDFTPVKAMIDFLPGQSSATFTVPIVDTGIPGPARTVKIALFGASPIGLGAPSTAVLTIVYDDIASIVHDPFNPLALARTPPRNDPLTGARFFIDHTWGKAALAANALRRSHPSSARQLDVIANQPEAHRFGNWAPNVALDAEYYFHRAALAEPGTVPMIPPTTSSTSTAATTQSRCPSSAPSTRWIQALATGIGNYRAILFLEMDAIITEGCLSPAGLQVRMHELHDAIDILSKVPRLSSTSTPAPPTRCR